MLSLSSVAAQQSDGAGWERVEAQWFPRSVQPDTPWLLTAFARSLGKGELCRLWWRYRKQFSGRAASWEAFSPVSLHRPPLQELACHRRRSFFQLPVSCCRLWLQQAGPPGPALSPRPFGPGSSKWKKEEAKGATESLGKIRPPRCPVTPSTKQCNALRVDCLVWVENPKRWLGDCDYSSLYGITLVDCCVSKAQ